MEKLYPIGSSSKASETPVFSSGYAYFLIRNLIPLLFALLLSGLSYGQCTVYDGQGQAVNNPVWVSCTGGAFTLYVQSPNNFGYTIIDWGDGSPNTVVTSIIPPAFVSHTYAAAITNSGGAHEISIIYEIASDRKKRKRRRSRFFIPCAKF